MTFERASGLQRAGAIALAATLARMPLAAKLELSPDEAYYWLWSRRLALSYYDHPPMIAWLIALSTKLFGNGELAVRLPALFCGAIVIVALAACAWRLAPEPRADAAAGITALLAAVMPLTHAGSILVSPDSPAAACWALTLAALAFAFTGVPWAWYLAGLALGAGLLSKYTVVLLGGSMALLVLVDGPTRATLRTFGPWAAAALSIAAFTPVILWNRDHGWVSFLFQFHHGTGAGGGFHRGVEFLGSQLAIATPMLLVMAALAVWRGGFARSKQAERLLFLAFLPTFTLFSLLAFKSKPEANWAAFAYLSLAPIAGMALAQVLDAPERDRHARWMFALYLSTIAIVVPVSVLASIHAVHPLVDLPVDRLRTEFHGWRARGEAARAAAGPEGILLGDSYRVAAELAYYGGRVEGVGVARLPPERTSMFDVWEGPTIREGADVVYVSWYERDVPPSWASAFREVIAVPPPPGTPATIARLVSLERTPPTRPGTLARGGAP